MIVILMGIGPLDTLYRKHMYRRSKFRVTPASFCDSKQCPGLELS